MFSALPSPDGAIPLPEPRRCSGGASAPCPLAEGRLHGHRRWCGPPSAGAAGPRGWLDAYRHGRRGPGRRAEALLRTRLGLAVGAVLFFALLQLLGGFVWCIDFGAMDADLQPAMRALLADCHIQEGTRLTQPASAGGTGAGAAPERGLWVDKPELHRRVPADREHSGAEPDRAANPATAGAVRQSGRQNSCGGNAKRFCAGEGWRYSHTRPAAGIRRAP